MKGIKYSAFAALVWTVLAFGGGTSVAQLIQLAADAKAPEAKAEAGPATGDPKKDAAAGLGQRSDREVTLGEQLGFREREVHGEMTELENRMFQLSKALRELEPENSSRLVIGLKYAREELILRQMEEVQQALTTASLKGAIEEQKQLMVKLERLQQLLLSTDLDFEMRIQRLRQIRETLRKLDTVIKEEGRQEQVSKKAGELEKRLESLAKRKAALEELVKQQTAHVKENTPLAKAADAAEVKPAVDKLAQAQQNTQKDTQALAKDLQDGSSPKNLVGASENMQSAVDALKKAAPAEALPPMEKALEQLKKELDDAAKQEAEAQAALAKEKFEAMKKEQASNRRANDDVSEMTRQLGSNGTAALAELLRASGSMSGAEGAFGNCQACQGNGEQGRALSSLKYAKELLAEEAERLARQLRAEVKKRVKEGLTLMLEMQTEVRQRTEALAPAVNDGSRQALSALAALAKREEKITTTAQELIDIVEETEFGIALPAALAAVRDATEGVQISLGEGDASADVVKSEKQIEADLKAMLEVVDEMSDANSRKGRRAPPNSPEEQRKELNRIISELKMIRLLEARVRENTGETDARRAASAGSPAADLRKRIEQLEGRQSDIQEATELLATERGDELPQPE